MNSLNILFYLYRYPGWGGIETVTTIVTSELIRRGHNIFIISETAQETEIPHQSDNYIYRLPNSLNGLEKNKELVNSLIQEKHIDIIIYQDCYVRNEKIPIDVSTQNNIPLIVFEHNTPVRFENIKFIDNKYSLKGIIKRLIYPYFKHKYIAEDVERKKRLYANCCKYVMLSKSYVCEIQKLLHINNLTNKFDYIYNPSIIDKSKTVKKSNEVIFVGRLEKEKGVDKLLRIWEYIECHSLEYKLIIVGDGSQKDTLISLSNSLGLKNVSFVGFQNPINYYRKAKLFLMASKYEGWPMTIIEAMTYGCVPVVENNFSALSEMIEDRYNGIIMPPKSKIKNWGVNIISLLEEKSELEIMSENCIKSIEKYNVISIIDQWENLFENILRNTR